MVPTATSTGTVCTWKRTQNIQGLIRHGTLWKVSFFAAEQIFSSVSGVQCYKLHKTMYSVLSHNAALHCDNQFFFYCTTAVLGNVQFKHSQKRDCTLCFNCTLWVCHTIESDKYLKMICQSPEKTSSTLCSVIDSPAGFRPNRPHWAAK